MKQVLMVAEKPSIAKAIATALSDGTPVRERKGISPVCSVLEFEGFCPLVKGGKEKVWIKVTSCAGHVYKLEFTKEYLDWKRVKPIGLFDATTEKLEANGKMRMPAHFREEAKGCDFLVLWLDCDLEGENICFEVMRTACCNDDDYNSKQIKRKNAYRAIFSALDVGSLKKAYWELNGRPNKNESDAVDCRQELDLRIGCAWTRFQTQFFQGRFKDLDASLISYGPCQTPTLWFCVQRQDEIDAFKPEKFYNLHLNLKIRSLFNVFKDRMIEQDPQCRLQKSMNFRDKYQRWQSEQRSGQRDETIQLEWNNGPIFSKECGEGMKKMLFVDENEQKRKGEEAGSAQKYAVPENSGENGGPPKNNQYLNQLYNFSLTVTQASAKEARSERPQGLNTVQLLKLASSQLSMGPHETMKEAEHLYLRGYLTYPRTETTAYPPGLDIDGLLRGQCRNPIWGNLAIQLIEMGRKAPRKGFDAGDHPPITPTVQIPGSIGEIGSPRAWKLYEMVCRNFMASIAGDMIFLNRKYTLTLAQECGKGGRSQPGAVSYDFGLSDKQLLDPGFQRFLQQNFDEDHFARSFNDSIPYDIGEHFTLNDRYYFTVNPVQDEQMYFKKSNRRVVSNDFILELTEHQSSPPEHLTESELLGLMDSNGIGTDASMATHIDTICNKRAYVEVTNGRRLIPSRVGINLIHAYSCVDNELCVPKMRQDMEKACALIAKGQARKQDVIRHMLSVFKSKFAFFSENTALMDDLFKREYEFMSACGGLDIFAQRAASSGKSKGKKGKKAGPSHDELLELKRLGLDKGEFGQKGKGKGKGKKDKGKGDREGGKGKKGRRGRDDHDDYVSPDDRQYLASNNDAAVGAGITIVSNKEKEILKCEKRIREVERLEQQLAEGKKLDALQQKKIEQKQEFMQELERLLLK